MVVFACRTRIPTMPSFFSFFLSWGWVLDSEYLPNYYQAHLWVVVNKSIEPSKSNLHQKGFKLNRTSLATFFSKQKSSRTPNVSWEQVSAMIGDHQAIRGDQLTLRQSTSVLSVICKAFPLLLPQMFPRQKKIIFRENSQIV